MTAPSSYAFTSGLSAAFRLGAAHKLEEGAVVQGVTALHVSVSHSGIPSVSTQIAALRKLLLGHKKDESSYWYGKVAHVGVSKVSASTTSILFFRVKYLLWFILQVPISFRLSYY